MRAYHFVCVIALIGLVSVALPTQPQALTLTLVQNDTSSFPTTGGSQTPDFTIGPTTWDTPNTSSVNFRTPWDDLGSPYNTLQYTSVRSGTAGYNLVGTSLSLFWGSVDWYNQLSFYTEANAGGSSITFDTNLLGGPTGLGHHLVTILTDFTFQSVTLTSGYAAFEFAQLTTTPIPAALPLLATGLGMIGWLCRRRKRRAPN